MHVWALGLSCATPAALQMCTFQGPGLQKHHQNSTRRPLRGKKRTNFAAGEGKKRANLGAVQGKGGPGEGRSKGTVQGKGGPRRAVQGKWGPREGRSKPNLETQHPHMKPHSDTVKLVHATQTTHNTTQQIKLDLPLKHKL